MRWSDFAYAQYVTNEEYLYNSIMMLEALHRVEVQADRIILYPEDYKVPVDNESSGDPTGKLLAQARDLYGAKLIPIQVQKIAKGDETWQESYTKLLVFNQTQYKRIISLDSDATVQKPMDELFLLPPTTVAMPRAYWMDQLFLSSHIVVIEPSEREWKRIERSMYQNKDPGFDMDILNSLYNNTCAIIPHRRYGMLSLELREEEHTNYLGTDEMWNGSKALGEASFVHFSDWPRPKAWLEASDLVIEAVQPQCEKVGSEEICTDRELWHSLYKDFADRREVSPARNLPKPKANLADSGFVVVGMTISRI
ncbi:nucleotide-diphospho-sugar transferase [Lophiotrema nucula]|uniref:Nucleotide-diphospho-sugar transferase n=1 Tax=Lophiotrema nucula TaxID=690887 RepID=A0A6A5Z7H5_9PLEO|nr:nucleotide-diphospho-sugar transferase [Lophiotrema nucula]